MREVVGIARWRWIEVRELGCVGLSENDGTREPQRGDDIGIGGRRRAVRTQLTVRQRRDAGDVDVVLDADRNTMQRSTEAARFGITVEQICLRPRTVARDMAPSLDSGINRINA